MWRPRSPRRRRLADAPMAVRTWLQQATPITFGLKAAGWLDALDRTRRRLQTALDAALVLQFGGASGTLGALGSHGLAVTDALAGRLRLRVPDTPWHAHRDRLAHLACALGVVTGTAGKIARDLSLLAQGEIGEAFEAPVHRPGSVPADRSRSFAPNRRVTCFMGKNIGASRLCAPQGESRIQYSLRSPARL